MNNAAEYQEVEVEDQKPGLIKRFDLVNNYENGQQTEEAVDGEFVKYEDHLRAMLNPHEQQLCRDMPSLYRMFQFLLDNIADLEQDEEFSGFQLQRATNDSGELMFIKLIPCDKIGDIVSPRIQDVSENKKIKAAVKDAVRILTPDGNSIHM